VRGSTRKPCAKSDAGQGSATYIYGSWEALRYARRNSINMGWRHVSFRGFADYMQTSEFNPGLQRLIQLTHQKRARCCEAVPWRWHRSLIADALTLQGQIEDIMSKTRSHTYSRISFGRVRNNHVTYPINNASRQ